MLYTYQQVLHLIENDEAYKQKEPTGKKGVKRERKTDRENEKRQKERKKERKKEMKERKKKKERVLRQESEKLVIKYMYITLNTTFTSTSYLLTNKCCT